MARKKEKSLKNQIIILVIVGITILLERFQLLDGSVADKIKNMIEDFEVATGLEQQSNGNKGVYKNEAIDGADLEVHYIDVDQGDATLIRYNDYTMLIDTGERNEADELISYLQYIGLDEIDTFVGTHPHSDHIGAVTEVFNEYDVKEVIIPNATHTTKTFEKMLTAIENEGSKVIEAFAGYEFAIDDFSYEILSPTRESYKDLNDYSVVILMEYKDVSFIFSGDATKVVERDILETGKNINADILKVAHHGSSSSSAEEFIKAVRPSIGIISLGAENDYGHPHKEVENVLNKYNIETFRTDINENIIVTTDGVNYNVQNVVH